MDVIDQSHTDMHTHEYIQIYMGVESLVIFICLPSLSIVQGSERMRKIVLERGARAVLAQPDQARRALHRRQHRGF